jgi:hypothetical protein
MGGGGSAATQRGSEGGLRPPHPQMADSNGRMTDDPCWWWRRLRPRDSPAGRWGWYRRNRLVLLFPKVP